jgi:hypothetical protein
MDTYEEALNTPFEVLLLNFDIEFSWFYLLFEHLFINFG